MPRVMPDNDILGQFGVLLSVCESPEWRELWDMLGCEVCSFASFGLPEDAADADIWQTCQDNGVVLVTGNRNADGPDSLEVAIREQGNAESLPVLTLANSDRLMQSRDYALRAAERLLEILIDLDHLRGAGRLFLP